MILMSLRSSVQSSDRNFSVDSFDDGMNADCVCLLLPLQIALMLSHARLPLLCLFWFCTLLLAASDLVLCLFIQRTIQTIPGEGLALPGRV